MNINFTVIVVNTLKEKSGVKESQGEGDKGGEMKPVMGAIVETQVRTLAAQFPCSDDAAGLQAVWEHKDHTKLYE